MSTIAARLRAGGAAEEVGVIGVDGRSGSGKSTVAAALAASYGDATVVHTDDVAWHHSFFDWDQQLVDHVLTPLRRERTTAVIPPAAVGRAPPARSHQHRRAHRDGRRGGRRIVSREPAPLV